MKKKTTATLALALAVMLLFAACGGSPASQSTAAPSTATAAPSTPEPTPEPEETALEVGDTGALGDWSITLDTFEFTDRIDGEYSTYFSPDDGCKYGVANLSVMNNATSAASFLPTYAMMSSDVRAKVQCGEYEFSATNLLALRSDLHDETVNPLVTISGVIAFNIPDSIVDGSDPLVLTLTQGKNTLEFSLR